MFTKFFRKSVLAEFLFRNIFDDNIFEAKCCSTEVTKWFSTKYRLSNHVEWREMPTIQIAMI